MTLRRRFGYYRTVQPHPARGRTRPSGGAGYAVKRHAQADTFAWIQAIRIVEGKMDGGGGPATGRPVIEVSP